MYKYIFVDHLSLQKSKMSSAHIGFQNRTYNDLSGIGIPELLTNIMPCHGFVNDKDSTVIFLCSSKLVDYYL